MLINENDRPKNQTKEHYELSQIAKLLAKHRGCTIIAEEVDWFKDKKAHHNKNKSGVVDVCGVKIDGSKVKELPKIDFYAYESKSTLSDFNAGFSSGADYNYVIAPKGVIPKDKIPKGIGFYEVDLSNYKITYKRVIKGIECVKRASRRKFRIHYRTRILKLINVARRATNMDLYKYCKIKLVTGE